MSRLEPRVRARYEELIEHLLDEQLYVCGDGIRTAYYWYAHESAIRGGLLRARAEEQLAFVLTAMDWIESYERPPGPEHGGPVPLVRSLMLELVGRKLPFGEDDVVALLDWSLCQPPGYYPHPREMIAAVEAYLERDTLTPALREKVGQFAEHLDYGYTGSFDTYEFAIRLKDLANLPRSVVPLAIGEPWSDTAIADLEATSEEVRSVWISLLDICAESDGSKPTRKWLKKAEPLLKEIGFLEFRDAVLRWFPLVDKPRARRIESWSEYEPDPNSMIHPVNSAVLKGLVWLCAESEDKELARTLTTLALSAYRKVPQIGPRCVKVGNACVWALGNMPGTDSIGQLALLKVKVKFGTAQKGIEKALNAAAEREGLPREEIEEMSVPAYGLTQVGLRHERLGDFTAGLAVTGTSTTELRWVKPDGKTQKSVPKAVKEGFAEELKELKGAAKDIQKMLPAQRDRVEGLYLEGKSWPYPVWRERYLDHPLVGTLARRLIWTFTDGNRTGTGVWHDGGLVDRTGRALGWMDASTWVELWHPIHESTQTVMAWRDWLAELEISQPFKQAHREVYLLTDAERGTRVYSNRFAAHVLKQHQFNALCAQRGWKNKLRLMVDDVYPPATRPMTAHGLRAEFWVESVGGAGADYQDYVTGTGTHLYVATDQVRFYRQDTPENLAHASGGGYGQGWRRGAPAEPLALEEVPPLVFSEVMRDADLFVGVASVGNDPDWSDGGPEGRFRDYWTGYSFGDLSETAKTRKQVLERLVPRLKIADRCSFSDRFLVVQGDVRTYRIHLGSGNILMEPNDQYLCIVSAQGAANVSGKVFLPFEGDRTLAIILSKAFLLAEDRNIKDPTILHQIGG